MATVPGNSFQRRIRNITKQTKIPSSGTERRISGTILKVYDADTPIEELPEALYQAYLRGPGRLFAQVQTNSNRMIYLPFRESAEYIYSIYGDATAIEGRSCIISCYENLLEAGELIITGTIANTLLETNNSTMIFSISGVFGG